jgi:hypothetical protein
MFQGEEAGAESTNNGATGPVKNAASMNNQVREVREQRREKFLIEFNSSQLYVSLRQKLKKAIFRLAVEKYNK